MVDYESLRDNLSASETTSNEDLQNVAKDLATIGNWEIPRFQDVRIAREGIENSVLNILPDYAGSNVVVLGVCAGNGVVEHAVADILREQGINGVHIVSTDIAPKPALFAKGDIPEDVVAVDALKLGEMRDSIMKLTSFNDEDKPTKILAVSRAWHHYFPNDMGEGVFEAISQILEPGEVFIDLPSSGSRMFLQAMESLHKAVGKSYKYHDMNTYMQSAGNYFDDGIKFNKGAGRIPRSLKTDFAYRYNNGLVTQSPEATTQVLGLYKHIIEQAINGQGGVDMNDYHLMTPNPQEEIDELVKNLKTGGRINGSIHHGNEITYVYDAEGNLVDIIATYTYPQMVCSR